MPRIDPQQLLNCLQVLLTPNGGILSKDEVQRLANLMTKFSKKLVSKCIYVLILKNTDRHLLGSFMAEGGWNLIHIWLQDAHMNQNWALVTEVLELLLITPVDVERLKMNNLPKLVKSFTRRDDLPGVQQLSTKLVDEWLQLVKDVTKQEAARLQTLKSEDVEQSTENYEGEPMEVDGVKSEVKSSENTDNTLRFKLAVKDGKQVISKIETSESTVKDEVLSENISEEEKKDEKKKEKSNHDRNKHRSNSSSSSSSSKGSSSSKDKSRDKSKDSKERSSSSSSSKSSKDRDKDKRDKHRSNGASKHRSSSSSSSKTSNSKDKDKDRKDTKEKQAEKDKDTLAKIQPQAISKLGRIPKKNDEKSSKKEEAKKPTFSVEVRKTEEKPKTVKVYNSKMRSTGLLEEAKPPPPRPVAKKPPTVLPPTIPTKRSSPIRDIIPPPEKKSRLLDVPERPGAIKLIPPKPKPAVLQESDIFMDALTASATAKKEPKKRKRRPSTCKETSPPSSPAPTTPTSPTTNLKSITANFYQDTLETETENDDEKNKENEDVSNEKTEIPDTPAEPDEEVLETTKTDANGLKGVLSYSKRKGPKRSVRWKSEEDLVEIQYFELDETERVNVMKPFMDMARMEMTSEREALRARKLPNEDTMDSQISWRALLEMDLPPPQAELGSKSMEKDIQFAREKRVLQSLYFNNRIPDSPAEADLENHPLTNPVIIPLDDPENPEQDTPVQPWPEPKGSPPHVPNVPPNMFPPNIPGPPFINMPGPPAAFNPGMPQPFMPQGFMPPNMMRPPGDWNGIPNGMPPPSMPPPDMMNQGPPNMFENFGPGPGMPENGFPPPFQPPMFPPNNFNNMRGRGGFRGRNTGPWIRMAGPGPNPGGWQGRGGGNPNRGGRFCLNVKKHGYCRNRENCQFIHPN